MDLFTAMISSVKVEYIFIKTDENAIEREIRTSKSLSQKTSFKITPTHAILKMTKNPALNVSIFSLYYIFITETHGKYKLKFIGHIQSYRVQS